jgi:hypothetical protein
MVLPSVEVTKGKEPWEESSTEQASPAILEENRTNKSQDLLLSLLRTQHTCEVHPDLNKIIQVFNFYIQ